MSNLLTCVVEYGKPSARKSNWYKYYSPIRVKLDARYLVASGDSDPILMDYDCNTNVIQCPDIYWHRKLREDSLNLLWFREALPARSDGNTYPRHWRSLLACFELAKVTGCERLLTLESDSWALTRRLADRLGGFPSGIGCPWCACHSMVELMLAVYHRDIYGKMIDFIKAKSWAEWAKPQPHNLERTVGAHFNVQPWMDLVGDRYCERDPAEQTPPADADFIIQGEGITPAWKG
jgi:hypothetical protein